jgi:hypothetical protein
LRALHCRGELRSPGHGRPQDAPTIETIILVTFYEIINVDLARNHGVEGVYKENPISHEAK